MHAQICGIARRHGDFHPIGRHPDLSHCGTVGAVANFFDELEVI